MYKWVNMYIEGGATVTVNSGRTLSVCGDWNTFNAYTTDTVSEVKGAGKVIMNGGFTQGFTGISRFKLLELDNILGAAIGANAVASVETGLHLILGDLNTTAGTLHLLSKSATHSAYLDNFTPGFAGTLTGNIYMDRFMPIRGFNQHYMSSPVSAPTLKQLGASGPDGIFVKPMLTAMKQRVLTILLMERCSLMMIRTWVQDSANWATGKSKVRARWTTVAAIHPTNREIQLEA
ncbi:MAG: hypothetical protein IPP77_05180 [Bacteroidetes bacterium]|nr:hypothetical protein [Bacteroidota bacterium]